MIMNYGISVLFRLIPLFAALFCFSFGSLVLEDLKADVVEVKLWDMGKDGSYPAVREECYIEVNSYGGDTSGYQIPFTLHYTGRKEKGSFDVTTKTFTAA